MTNLLLQSLLATQLLAATPEETRFLEAVTRYDVPAVRSLLTADPGLAQRARTPRGASALVAAAYVNIDSEYFYPPEKNEVLHEVIRVAPPADAWEACLVGDLPRAQAFLDQDSASLRAQKMGWTLLHAAAYSGNVELVKWLIGRGATIDATANTAYKNTPLQVAMLTRQSAAARALVEAGADVNFKNEENYTVLHDAARQGNTELVHFFLQHGAVAKQTLHGETPVSSARSHGYLALADELEKLGAPVPSSSPPPTDRPAADLWLKCRGCHGMDAKGNTKPGAEEKISDFTSAAWQAKTTDEWILKVITHGSERNQKMKGYRDRFTPNEIASLLPYIRSLKGK